MEKLAIIKNVNIGVGDYGKACMWFDTYVDEHSAALQVLSWEKTATILEAACVRSALFLEGKACYVNDADGFIKFIRLAKI